MRDAYQDQLDELATSLAGMCEEVADALAKATRALLQVDLHLAEEVITEDVRVDELRAHAMDALHKHMSSVLMDRSGSHGVGPAVDITLLARFYERYADHAVAAARRIVYVVTGRMPGPLAV